MIWCIGIGILVLGLFFIFYIIVEAYEDGKGWIKEVIKSEKEIALKRMWEEKNGTPFISKEEDIVIPEWEDESYSAE